MKSFIIFVLALSVFSFSAHAITITKTLSANGSVCFERNTKPTGFVPYFASIGIYGTYGGGTVTVKTSFDNGTTKINSTDLTGYSPITSTSDTVFTVSNLGNGAIICSELSGATNPSITFKYTDNN